MNENLALVEISKAQMALENAHEIGEVLDLRDKFMAMQILANAQGFKEAAQEAKIYQLKAERKAGEWLSNNVKHQSPFLKSQDATSGLPDGVDKYESSRWQLEASVPEEKFNDWIDECLSTNKEITASGLQRIGWGEPHVLFNSGNNEWYTPPEYIEAARQVLGEIDLDPASSETANKIVRAKIYFTAEDDGLKYEWDGRVWMNPPYSSDLIGKFTEKLAFHYKNGDISEAIILINNATETNWFQTVLNYATAVCFVRGRIKYCNENGIPENTGLQGQAILYLGGNINLFDNIFREFGIVLFGRGENAFI